MSSVLTIAVFFSLLINFSVTGILRINMFLSYFRASSKFKDTRKGDGTLLGSCLVIGKDRTVLIHNHKYSFRSR